MLPDMQEDTGQSGPQESMSVSEAAEYLGLTEDAVRKRIHREKIRYERDSDGRYLVYPTQEDIRQTQDTNYAQSESSALTSSLEARITSLEAQLEQANERDRENRRLLAAALERIPAIEPPSDERESSVEKSEESEANPTPEEPPRTWWRRWFQSR
jgi:excisionase family DNA binding protein